jgi:hypothetical protein
MYTDMNGLGKFKLPKMKNIKKLLMTHPLAPTPVKMMALQKKMSAKKAAPAIAPSVAEPVTFTPAEQIYAPQYQPMPYGGFYPPQQQQQPQPMPQAPQYYAQPMPQAPQYAEHSARAIPEDFYSTDIFDYNFDADEPAASNTPTITPYESAAASTFGTEEDFMDTSAAYESEAGYLNGLGQEAGSTGGWFTDLISTGTKAYAEIAKAKAAAKAARVPAPVFGTGTYKPVPAFGTGFNLNTALMFVGLGLGGFLLYKTLAKKRR